MRILWRHNKVSDTWTVRVLRNGECGARRDPPAPVRQYVIDPRVPEQPLLLMGLVRFLKSELAAVQADARSSWTMFLSMSQFAQEASSSPTVRDYLEPL